MAFVYSCCFWFSLRLGGILIGLFSAAQAIIFIVGNSMAYEHINCVKEVLSDWIDNMELIYVKPYLEYVLAEPEKYITLNLCTTSIYLLLCIVYIYGAYVCNIVAMLGYVLVEVMRLLTITIVLITWLLILKENTMDIGLLIGASVASGFYLLGMAYLWLCSANLPVLINEKELDERAATIEKLKQLVEVNHLSTYSQSMDEFHRNTNRSNMFYFR